MERAYPVFRIDDYEEAKNYYVGFLGFNINLEVRFQEDFPVFMVISRGDVVLNLSEHRGDTPGPGAARIEVESVHTLFDELKPKRSEMSDDLLVDQSWGWTELFLTDPFGNKLTFTSPTPKFGL